MRPHTLILMEAGVVAFCSALMFIARGRERDCDAITIWAIGMASGALGLLLMVVPAPEFVTNDLAIALILSATGIAWTAARCFAGSPLVPHWALAGAAVWLLACRLPMMQSHPAQSALSWGLGAVYSFATAAAIWPDGREALTARPAMIALLVVHGAVYALRAATALIGLDEAFRQTFSNALLIEGQFRVIGMAFLVIAMSKQRADLTIAASLESARQAVEARQRFLAQMSHEVRTPLNGVLGLAQVLVRDNRLLADQRQNAQALEAAGRHLLAIVNDVLDLAKIDAGRMDFVGRSFDLEEAADGCLALVRPAATDKRLTLGLEFDPTLPPLAVGDRTRLQQILLNLLWNALKFTPVGGSVTLRLAPAQAGLRFEVQDTGPGIPADRQHLLFQDFSQLEPSEGTGLGLAISARLARQMEGSLAYYPGPGGIGSLFRLELPWPAASGGLETPVETVSQLPSPGRDLLVVDDVRVNRRLLQALLAAEGHRVTEAQSGAEALSMLTRQRFDAVLLDLHMPGMDGFEAARRIRAQTGSGETAIIAVSADVMPATVQACLAEGMQAVIAKPVDRTLLLSALGQIGPRRGFSRPVTGYDGAGNAAY
jgi:signal transduction histidine kinase/ActR/RegA family two-component response regulator